ncbi:MAG: tRNA (adenosine(37)-N6)-dimethylallyltransferase MiaA [Alphaproteobacteria bacterium]|nr:tRNA (adenosine(37)-N6)-dimethylallyltransferase MiaA [Alphaproteobacteria bacterium]
MRADGGDGGCVVIAGPTASGKTALALAAARRFGGEIVNADSMQIYSGMAVLTDAPDEAARAGVPHHLFGVLDPAGPCSAGAWRDMALAAIAGIRARGRTPIVVGGTGLYIRVLMRGIAGVPAVPAGMRAALRARGAAMTAEALHAELARCDPAAADRIDAGDRQRVLRALEVLEATGRSLLEWQRAAPPEDTGGLRFFTVLLMPPRERVYAAIDARFETMVERGALDEVAALARRGLDPELPAMKALGVPALCRHLAGEIGRDAAVRAAQQASRRYAKRQMTWFRHQFVADMVVGSQFSECHQTEIFAKISNFLLTRPG